MNSFVSMFLLLLSCLNLKFSYFALVASCQKKKKRKEKRCASLIKMCAHQKEKKQVAQIVAKVLVDFKSVLIIFPS